MKLSKLKLCNYRCFGNDEQTIKIENITSFIGNNSSGKTAALSALNCLFSEISSERILKRSDFHLPKDIRPELQESQDMYIEAVFTFDELEEGTEEESYAIPYFSNYLVVDDCEETPYLRVRLEATWQNSNNIEGAIESKIYYITCSETQDITDEDKFVASRKDLDCIRVIYVPAVRDPSKQLRNVSGTMMYQLMNSINWSQAIKEKVKGKIQELNNHFLEEKGIEIISSSIRTQWESYDNDIRYSDAQLRFNSIDIESAIKKSEVVFSPTITGKEYGVDDLSDGLRSLFYISLVDSILDAEAKIQQQIETGDDDIASNYRPPVLTIIALEEPENHIAPHLMGQLVSNLINISSKHNAQTILTSHSTAIIKRLEPEKLRYFRFNISDCVTKVNSIILPDKEKMADQYKFIKEAVKAYPELYFAKVVILGEGDSEEIILPKIWSVKNGDIDLSGISVVPLGGRHVNHFWRLLKNLDIPYITLLDLDRERVGGGWGRIKYVLEQLLKLNYKKEDLLRVKSGILSDERLKKMHTWDSGEVEILQGWINRLEKYNVFFSTPLDIDFMMLEKYENIYKNILDDKEGPYLMINTKEKNYRRYIKEIEALETTCQEYETRINIDVHNTLKSCGGNGDTYSREQRKLMIWYNYFFLNRGKPSTHIEALSKITNEMLISTMPSVFGRMITAVECMLEGPLE
ncbi:ATP-dependent nuclease [Veillonella atypica]|uniref:ATP-dependent nuclease n=1 Tax=Veillonella atypica TaxID=39777 RepID=UPI002E78839D|nr:AAA family ATPase [Veillonella atypica]